MPNPITSKNLLRSFGRVKGRKLRPEQQEVFDRLFPQLSIDLDNFTISNNSWLEIGFGGGEHLAEVAKANPDIDFIGCEPFLNGVASLLKHIDKSSLNNIRILNGDARLLLEKLPEESIERVFILFPDPWPKLKHRKKRLISNDMLDELARVIKAGGQLLIATDHVDYAKWIDKVLQGYKAFDGEVSSNPPKGWVETRYQQKASKEGREPVFFELVKNVSQNKDSG